MATHIALSFPFHTRTTSAVLFSVNDIIYWIVFHLSLAYSHARVLHDIFGSILLKMLLKSCELVKRRKTYFSCATWIRIIRFCFKHIIAMYCMCVVYVRGIALFYSHPLWISWTVWPVVSRWVCVRRELSMRRASWLVGVEVTFLSLHSSVWFFLLPMPTLPLPLPQIATLDSNPFDNSILSMINYNTLERIKTQLVVPIWYIVTWICPLLSLFSLTPIIGDAEMEKISEWAQLFVIFEYVYTRKMYYMIYT